MRSWRIVWGHRDAGGLQREAGGRTAERTIEALASISIPVRASKSAMISSRASGPSSALLSTEEAVDKSDTSLTIDSSVITIAAG